MTDSNPGRNGQNRSDHQDFEDWEAVFEDSDPTRVLNPRAEQWSAADPTTQQSQVATHSGADLSATRYGQAPSGFPGSAGPTTPAAPLPAVPPAPQAAPAQINPAASFPGPPLNVRASQARVQFLPALSGALVAAAVIAGTLATTRFILTSMGTAVYPGPTEAVLAVTATSTQLAALPWTITTALALLLGYALAGYTATRMTALAPGKQALGVVAVSAFGVLLATLLTWATSSADVPLRPGFALQPLVGPDPVFGTLTTLATGVLALLGALLGASAGTRYHKRLGPISYAGAGR
ncbi:hypothetical protein [Rothia nasisuis]|uniref:hypothetical protein n=1 Tax=Rothia nasisuis TaxID=2109647 RepID=UPI001F46002A|nr:hypothetical protein [Rothia nasisuis]